MRMPSVAQQFWNPQVYHKRAAKASAATLIHTRPSKLTAKAALVVLDWVVGAFVGAGAFVGEEESVLDVLKVILATELELEVVAGVTTGADVDVPFAETDPKFGAATAVEGSTRVPTPHGMGSFEPG